MYDTLKSFLHRIFLADFLRGRSPGLFSTLPVCTDLHRFETDIQNVIAYVHSQFVHNLDKDQLPYQLVFGVWKETNTSTGRTRKLHADSAENKYPSAEVNIYLK